MSLDDIYDEIVEHEDNAAFTRAGLRPVYAAYPPAKVLIIGQAPGRQAQETGVPWNDASGEKLREWLGVEDEIFYDPERFALVPMDFYYPGKGENGDLPPRKEFAPRWHPPILELLGEVELTILIGQFAQQHYLADSMKRNLTETVRAFEEYLPAKFPIVHPSPLTGRWRAQNPWFEQDVVPRLRGMVDELVAPG